jgi:hypothetical protein
MRKLLILFFVTLISVKLFAPGFVCGYIVRAEAIQPYNDLWYAVCQVESDCDAMAYNSHEGAVGIAQIRAIRLKHYNTLTGKNYALREMYDTLKAKEVFMYFCNGSYEEISKSWNGRGRMTEVYWMKVKASLESI